VPKPINEVSLAGKTISNYHIHSKLGEGSLGVVYKARDNKLSRLVALKFLPSDLEGEEVALQRRGVADYVGTQSSQHLFDLRRPEDGGWPTLHCYGV
jgi:serine/threonine protein kinase